MEDQRKEPHPASNHSPLLCLPVPNKNKVHLALNHPRCHLVVKSCYCIVLSGHSCRLRRQKQSSRLVDTPEWDGGESGSLTLPAPRVGGANARPHSPRHVHILSRQLTLEPGVRGLLACRSGPASCAPCGLWVANDGGNAQTPCSSPSRASPYLHQPPTPFPQLNLSSPDTWGVA